MTTLSSLVLTLLTRVSRETAPALAGEATSDSVVIVTPTSILAGIKDARTTVFDCPVSKLHVPFMCLVLEIAAAVTQGAGHAFLGLPHHTIKQDMTNVFTSTLFIPFSG